VDVALGRAAATRVAVFPDVLHALPKSVVDGRIGAPCSREQLLV